MSFQGKTTPADNTEQPIEDLKLEALDRFLASLAPTFGSLLESVSDAQRSLYLHSQDFGDRTLIKKGRILQSLPYFGWYRVAIEDQVGVTPCCKLSSVSTSSLYGTVDVVTFPADTPVAVMLHPNNPWGYILGAIPTTLEDGNFCFSDWVVQASHSGFREEYHSNYVTKTDDEGGVQNFAGQRPLDNLTVDGGLTTTTGVGLHIDPFLAYLRVSEVCGVFAFYPDEHLRVAGKTLEISSGSHQEMYRNDEGELTYFRGETPYAWEMMGAPEPNSQVLREIADSDVHTKRFYAKFEPLYDDQLPIYRYEEYGGYLGQGRIRQMTVPNAENSQQFNRQSSPLNRLGVFREHVGMDGELTVQSAKGVHFVKQSIISVAEPKQPADSLAAAADSSTSYKAAGAYGAGPAHKLQEIAFQGAETTMTAVVGILDKLAHATNWKSLNGFHYHTGDYQLPQADENPRLTKDFETPNFAELQTRSGFSPPTPQEIKIDERYTAKFYQVMSLFSFTDDGNLVLRAGRGCQLTFVDGEIYLDAPGNIVVRPGKTHAVLAGDDLILRARQSLEFSATEGSVRGKAEKELHLLAGNSGEGGMLLECRTRGKNHDYPYEGGDAIKGAGIVFKTPGQLTGMAGEIYWRTGGPKGDTIPAGPIVLDAAEGFEDIIQIARRHDRFAKLEMNDSFNYPKVNYVNHYEGYQNRFGGFVEVLGPIYTRGAVQAKLGFSTSDGHFQSPTGGEVGRLRNPEVVRRPLDLINESHERDKKTQSQTYEDDVKIAFYGEQKIGNVETQRKISFGFRNAKEYGTTEFLMPQAYWQQLAQGSAATVAWQEKVVKYQEGEETMPWPGKKKWKDDATFCTLPANSHTMYDLANGQAKDRPYVDPKYGQLDKQTCNSSYIVIRVQ